MTEEERHKNGSELMNFVHYHKLMDNHSNIVFKGKLSIKTEKNEIKNEEFHFMGSNDGYENYGTITIFEDLNTDIFPSKFLAKYQTFEHINDIYLLINGSHPSPEIGNYQIMIVPIEQCGLPSL